MLVYGGGSPGETTGSISTPCLGASIRIIDVKEKTSCSPHSSLQFAATPIPQLAELGFPLLGTGRRGCSSSLRSNALKLFFSCWLWTPLASYSQGQDGLEKKACSSRMKSAMLGFSLY